MPGSRRLEVALPSAIRAPLSYRLHAVRVLGGLMQHAPGFLKLVEAARKRVRECTVDDVKRRLDAGEHFHLIDVREHEEWTRGHLPRAQHLCKGIIERDIERVVPDRGAEIVLYCGGGYRSALAADNLQQMGYTNVISMDGGWRGWNEAGHPVARD